MQTIWCELGIRSALQVDGVHLISKLTGVNLRRSSFQVDDVDLIMRASRYVLPPAHGNFHLCFLERQAMHACLRPPRPACTSTTLAPPLCVGLRGNPMSGEPAAPKRRRAAAAAGAEEDDLGYQGEMAEDASGTHPGRVRDGTEALGKEMLNNNPPLLPRPGQQYFYVWHMLRQGMRFPARSSHLPRGIWEICTMDHTIGEETCRNAAPQAPRAWNGPNRAAAAAAATAHAGATALAAARARWRERNAPSDNCAIAVRDTLAAAMQRSPWLTAPGPRSRRHSYTHTSLSMNGAVSRRFHESTCWS
eukprot:gene15332-biopygen21705